MMFPKPEKKKKSKRQIKDSELKKAILLCNKYYSYYIRQRDNHICFTCGRMINPKDSQNGHLFTRGKKSVLWNDLNCHCQCAGCNKLHEHQPEIYTVKFVEKYGWNTYYELYELSNQTVDLIASEVLEKAEYYKKLTGGFYE